MKELFPQIKQDYRYYIFFLKESKEFMDMEFLKYKNNALAAFKNYKALYKKKFACQLKVLYINHKREYIEEFNDYFKKNGITHKVTIPYSLK